VKLDDIRTQERHDLAKRIDNLFAGTKEEINVLIRMLSPEVRCISTCNSE
jgi:hypothetical protein